MFCHCISLSSNSRPMCAAYVRYSHYNFAHMQRLHRWTLRILHRGIAYSASSAALEPDTNRPKVFKFSLCDHSTLFLAFDLVLLPPKCCLCWQSDALQHKPDVLPLGQNSLQKLLDRECRAATCMHPYLCGASFCTDQAYQVEWSCLSMLIKPCLKKSTMHLQTETNPSIGSKHF